VRTIKIKVPSTIDLDDQEAATALAAKLFETGKLSLGQAAELAGFSKAAFMEVLSRYGVSVINQLPEDMPKDVANAKRHSI